MPHAMNTLTIDELIAALEEMRNMHGGEAPVLFAYNYGDHGRTTVAGQIRNVTEEVVKFSEYHGEFKVVPTDDGEYDEETGEALPMPTDCENVIVIR